MTCTKTQGQMLADKLREWPHTYGDMLEYGISTSPHKRVLEWLELQAKLSAPKPCPWILVKTKGYVFEKELVRWQIKRDPRCG